MIVTFATSMILLHGILNVSPIVSRSGVCVCSIVDDQRDLGCAYSHGKIWLQDIPKGSDIAESVYVVNMDIKKPSKKRALVQVTCAHSVITTH